MGILVNIVAGTNASILPDKTVEAILVNYPHDGISERAILTTNQMLGYAGCKYVMFDSGGFQFGEFEKKGREILCDPSCPPECSEKRLNLPIEHYVKAARKIRAQKMTTMDFPIKVRGTLAENEFEFLKKLGFNITWAKQTLEMRNRYCPEIQLFLAIQCYDLQQLEYFLKLLGPAEFDGFSIPPRNYSLAELALFIIKFYQIGVRRVHLLGTSEFSTTVFAAYMARHLFDWVSLDATSWRKSAESGFYLNQHDMAREMIYNVLIDERIENDCNCPLCLNKTFTYIKNLPQTDRINFLRCHNYWVIDRVTKELYKNADTISTLEKYLKRKCPDKVKVDEILRVISLVDFLKDQDIKHIQTMLL